MIEANPNILIGDSAYNSNKLDNNYYLIRVSK